ncbi:hypothetical protein IWX49DRAFT_558041 [Phyllosticta citricarpa]
MPCILPSAAASVASPYSSFRSVLALSSANPPENFDRDTAVARSRVNCQRCKHPSHSPPQDHCTQLIKYAGYECCVRSPGPLKAPLKPLCAIDQDLSNNAVIPSSPRFSVLVALVTSNFGYALPVYSTLSFTHYSHSPWLQPHSCHYTPPVPYYSYHVSFRYAPLIRSTLSFTHYSYDPQLRPCGVPPAPRCLARVHCQRCKLPSHSPPQDHCLQLIKYAGYECCVRSPVPLKASLTSLCASTPEYILNNTIILESPVPPALRCLARVHCQRCKLPSHTPPQDHCSQLIKYAGYECCVRSPVPLKASLTSLCASTPEDIMNNTIIL